ncbi:hypothetical protein [Natronorubrum texcoconense]|uniref:Uncharacterized protein n=1 Tax=Natronorubrum texcoconense TaxID=1095776 RepID=A0A1G9GMD7_9EURY|nr:hypothetical protein [Natronorubrum texcoconense]SDL01772.1 hypothetical protein SAMN04515672_4562 [Natronorubrum texcoconense]
MPSLDGFKTWFEYDILITAFAVVLVVVLVGLERFVGVARRLPLEHPAFALAVTGVGFGVILILLWVASRLNTQP